MNTVLIVSRKNIGNQLVFLHESNKAAFDFFKLLSGTEEHKHDTCDIFNLTNPEEYLKTLTKKK